MEEIWKDIKGYEGLYQVSTLGRIRSCAHLVQTINGFTRMSPSKIRSCCFDGNYYHVILYKNGERKVCLIHRLVANSFIPNPDCLPQVNHKDGNKLNNSVDNLEWCTAKENVIHAFNTCLKVPTISHYRGVLAFRLNDGSFVGEYKSQHEAARMHGLNVSHICSVLKKRVQHTCGYYFKYNGKEKCQNRTY